MMSLSVSPLRQGLALAFVQRNADGNYRPARFDSRDDVINTLGLPPLRGEAFAIRAKDQPYAILRTPVGEGVAIGSDALVVKKARSATNAAWDTDGTVDLELLKAERAVIDKAIAVEIPKELSPSVSKDLLEVLTLEQRQQLEASKTKRIQAEFESARECYPKATFALTNPDALNRPLPTEVISLNQAKILVQQELDKEPKKSLNIQA